MSCTSMAVAPSSDPYPRTTNGVPVSSSTKQRRFEGKTVLVTGAGTGFGAEIAVRAAEEGANVVVHYRSSKAGADATAARIQAVGQTAFLVQGDIAEWDDIRGMADAA